jgi:hypothetical protein
MLITLSRPQHSHSRKKVLVNALEAVRVSVEAMRVSIEALRYFRGRERLEEVPENVN